MKCVQLQETSVGFDLFPRRKEGVDPFRTDGVHLTDVIRSIMEESGISKTTSGGGWASNQLNMAAEVGFMWEELLSMVLKERLPSRVGEVMADGVIMSPDGVEMDDCGEVVLAEYKAVWASSRHSPADNWKWMSQVRGYCHGLGLTSVNMYILYLNGGWNGKGPEYKKFRIDFTPLEIQENWSMILNHARSKGWIE